MSAAELYPWVRALHVGCAALTIAGFAARGVLMLRESPWLQRPFVRVAPHVVDTVLLASAAWLAWFLGQIPSVPGWITAKILALILYVVLGMIALRRGRTKHQRTAAFAAALATAGYIVSVALTRDATPWS